MRYARMIIWLGVLFALLTGCGAVTPKAEPPATTGFTCQMAATYNGMDVKGTLTRGSAGTLTLDFSEPATLKDLSAVWNGDGVTLTLHGLSLKADAGTVPQVAIGSSVAGVLDTVLRGGGQREVGENEVVITGEEQGHAFSMTTDRKTGALKTMEIPSLPLKATFSNFQWDADSGK